MSIAITKMFDLGTLSWDPLGGRCPYNCIYCWSMGEKGLVKRYKMKKYQGPPRLMEKEFKAFKEGDFVFVQDMSDLLAEIVPKEYIERILEHAKKFPKTTFLLLTKNPERYLEFKDRIPSNCICGATVETNRDKEYRKISRAPLPTDRLVAMRLLRNDVRKMISIEPIMDFDLDDFVSEIEAIRPSFVYVGYDNYNYGLPEPLLPKTKELIAKLQEFTEVRTKSYSKATCESNMYLKTLLRGRGIYGRQFIIHAEWLKQQK
jgi:DNA repair photolyase